MEALLLIWPLLIIYLAMPLMTGWVAKTRGRNFWFWTILTCVLPLISLIILASIPDLSKSKSV